MKRRFVAHAVGCAMLVGAGGASAEDLGAGLSIHTDVAFTSNYVFRGLSLNDEEPAVQAGHEMAHDSGLYAGLWGSTGAVAEGFGVEINAYAGYAFELTPELLADVGVYHYHFPEDTDVDFTEVYAGLIQQFGRVEGDLYVHFSDEYEGVLNDDESSVYAETNWTVTLDGGFYGLVRAGYLDIDVDAREGYDWGVGAGYQYGSLDLNVLVVDQEEASDTQVAVTLSRAF